MKYVFSLDLKVDWLKMSNASLVVDETAQGNEQKGSIYMSSFSAGCFV